MNNTIKYHKTKIDKICKVLDLLGFKVTEITEYETKALDTPPIIHYEHAQEIDGEKIGHYFLCTNDIKNLIPSLIDYYFHWGNELGYSEATEKMNKDISNK